MRSALVAAFVALYGACSLWNYVGFDRLQRARERYQPTFAPLPKPEVVKILDLGFNNLAADWYWIKGVNYFGDQRNTQVAYGELYNYLDLVTELDPKFFAAYLFGGYALPWNRGDEWVNTKEASALLEKGIREFPGDWRLYFQLSYIYSAYLHEYKKAGDRLSAAATLPGAPDYLGGLATRMYATSGDFDAGESMAKQLMQMTADPREREALRKRFYELRAANEANRLSKAAQDYKATNGRFPASLKELESSGVTVRPEPLGGSWSYDPATGAVTSSTLHDRLTIFIHPREEAKAKGDAKSPAQPAADAGQSAPAPDSGASPAQPKANQP